MNDQRTLEQNNYMWMLLADVAAQLEHRGRHYGPDDWKAIFMRALGYPIKFLPTLEGDDFFPYMYSSRKLTVKQMNELIELILAEGAQRGVVFRDMPEASR
jgi:NinB protein